MAEQIKFVGELSRLDVKPGDRFVIHCDAHMSKETLDLLQEVWREFIGGDQTKLLVLTKGCRLGVIGAQADDEPPLPPADWDNRKSA